MNGNAGGVATAICPVLSSMAICKPQYLVPGRCLVSSHFVGEHILTVCNVHNYGLSSCDTATIKDFLFVLGSSIEVNPTSMLGVLVGDLNIKAEHERSFKVGSGFAGGPRDRGFSNPLFSGQRLGLWRSILSTWTKISQPMPTHFDFSSKSCSRIDRVWVFGLSNMLIKLQIRSHVLSTPEDYYGRGLSDHAPVIVSFGKHFRSASKPNSIPQFVCKHPKFEQHVYSFASYCDLLNFPVHRQLANLKVCFREASKVVLLEIQHDEENSLEARRLAFCSMSRALWFNDVSLAKKLLASSALAKVHLQVSDGKVSFINPAFF